MRTPLENSLQKSNVKCLFCDYNNKQVWLEKKYVGSRHNSEWFNTAGRNIKTGLIASVIVSQVCCWGSQTLRLRNSGTMSFFSTKRCDFWWLISVDITLKNPILTLWEHLNCSGHGLPQSCKAQMWHGSMVWVGPFGMPVVQPFKYNSHLLLCSRKSDWTSVEVFWGLLFSKTVTEYSLCGWFLLCRCYCLECWPLRSRGRHLARTQSVKLSKQDGDSMHTWCFCVSASWQTL